MSIETPIPRQGLVRAPQGLRTAQLLIAVSAILYGTQGIFASIAYDHGVSLGMLLGVRSACFALFALFLLNRRRRQTLRGHRRTVLIACITSIAGPLLYFAAVARMDPTTVTLIFFIYPALTVIGARILGRVHLTALSIVVTIVTLVGVGLAIGGPSGNIDLLGIVLALGFAVVISAYFLAAERGLEGVDPIAWLGVTVLAAALFFVPLAPFFGGLAVPDAQAGLALLGLVIVASMLPCLFQTAGLMRLGSAATSLVATLEIATVVVLSYVVLGERPGIVSLIGATLVIIGAVAAPIAIRRRTVLPSAL